MGIERDIGILLASTLLLLASGALADKPALAGDAASPSLAEPLRRRAGAEQLRGIRALNELQQRTARGDREALLQQPALALEIGKGLATLAPEVWAVARNRHDLIKYVLSGGDAAVLGRLLQADVFPETELPLARGALAYAQGDRHAAATHLAEVEHRLLGAPLAGHLALVRAVVVSNGNEADALALADEARLLSPGTIVEEAALRLTIEMSIAIGDQQRFDRAAIRYLTRFPASLYAGAIFSRVARVVAASSRFQTASGPQWLSDLGTVLPPDRRVSFYAEVAEAALRSGRLPLAEHAARLAVGAVGSGGTASATNRADLMALEGAATLFGARRAAGLRLLDEASALGASPEYGKLIDAARALSLMIVSPPAVLPDASSDIAEAAARRQEPEVARAESSAPRGRLQDGTHDLLLAKTRSALARADELLDMAGK